MAGVLGREQEARGRTFSKYVSMSFLASVILVYHAVIKHEQFYPAMEYLSTSKISLAILGNLGFASALVLYHVITFAFLGTLRDYETERVQDRVGQAIVETLLAMTIFRQNVESFGLLSRFVLLAFMKIFHWLAQDRVDFIETTQHVSLLQHARLMTMIVWLIISDLFLLHTSLVNTFSHGVSVHLLFAFEYSMQVSVAVAVLLKYTFSIIDMGIWNGSWRNKSIAVFYVDLTRDLVHLITYSAFFFVVFSTYGIPIHLIRDIYWTFRNFQTRVRDFLRYRQIAANMENRFPDASEEDLERSDHMCIVCREEMSSSMRAKRLPCNHVFHLDCLKSWLERQQNCPICRSAIPARDEGASHQDRPAPVEPLDEQVQPRQEPIHQDEPEGQHDTEVQEQTTEGPRDDAREAFLRRLESNRAQPEASTSQHAEETVPQDDTDAGDKQEPSTSSQYVMEEERDTADGTPPASSSQGATNEYFHPFLAPEDDDMLSERLRTMAARDLNMDPTEEQHARALAIAKAAAQAATLAAYAFPTTRHHNSS